jgi:hypothetical protein
MHKASVAVVVALAAAVAALGATQAAERSCGEYKYSKDGKCVDARDKTEKSWGDAMSSRAIW